MGVSLFCHAHSERTRRKGLKLRQGRFKLGIKKEFSLLGHALEQVAHEGDGVTIPGGVQETSGSMLGDTV